jgi:hypothetical protein
MSWSLLFFRRVGEPLLSLEETRRVFSRLPRFEEVPPREGQSDLTFAYHNPTSDVRFDFLFDCRLAERDPEADPGEVDFPFEVMPLRLRLGYEKPAEIAREALPVAGELAQSFDLLVLDPQSDQELPAEPDVEQLIRSYNTYAQDVAATMDYIRDRSRKMVLIGFTILLGALLFMVLNILAG